MTQTYETAGYLVLIPVVCVFGLAGNSLTLAVLCRGEVQGRIYSYFKALAFFDLCALTCHLPVFVLRYPFKSAPFRFTYTAKVFEKYIYLNVGDIFIKTSVWTTVLFTVDRCLSICLSRPIVPGQGKRRLWIRVSVVFASTSLESIPNFFQSNIVYNTHNNSSWMLVQSSSNFSLFYGWFDTVFAAILPGLIIFVFNVILVRFLIQRKREQRVNASLNGYTHAFREQTRILFTTFGVMLLFLLTMIPSLALQVVAITVELTPSVFVRIQITNSILTSIYLSCNFVFYCLMNRRFWTAFKNTVFKCCLYRCNARRKVEPQITWLSQNRLSLNIN